MNNNNNIVMQLLRSGGNPQAIFQQLMNMNNPQVSQALQEFNSAQNQMRQNGMSMEQYARQYAQQHGINLQEVMRSIGLN